MGTVHVDLLVHLNGVREVITTHSQEDMIINNEDMVLHLRINNIPQIMAITLPNSHYQEATLDPVGNRGLQSICKDLHRAVDMITMVDMMHRLLVLTRCILQVLQQWAHLHSSSQITITDSHMVKIMGSQLLILNQHHLSRGMVMDTKKPITCQLSRGMRMGVLSLFTPKQWLNRVMHSNNNMVTSRDTMHHLGQICLTKARFHQTNHILRMCQLSSSHTCTQQVPQCNNSRILLTLNHLLMGITSQHLLLRVRAIHSQ